MDWVEAVQELRRDGVPGVLVTVAAVRGHAPRDAGAKMVVGADVTWGSVGGGNLEETAVDRAREMITSMIDSRSVSPLTYVSRLNEHERTEHGRQCCGGEITLLLEPLPVRPTVAIFGLGHVGYELARILGRLDVRLHVVDSRRDQLDPLRLADLTEGLADVMVHRVLLGERVLDTLPRGAEVLIMTHDHAEDFALCDAALRIPTLGRIGLIGSRAKWRRFQKLLAEAGHTPEAIDRIVSPIGLPQIAGKEPAVIAISVAADLVTRWSSGPAVDAAPSSTSPRVLSEHA